MNETVEDRLVEQVKDLRKRISALEEKDEKFSERVRAILVESGIWERAAEDE